MRFGCFEIVVVLFLDFEERVWDLCLASDVEQNPNRLKATMLTTIIFDFFMTYSLWNYVNIGFLSLLIVGPHDRSSPQLTL